MTVPSRYTEDMTGREGEGSGTLGYPLVPCLAKRPSTRLRLALAAGLVLWCASTGALPADQNPPTMEERHQFLLKDEPRRLPGGNEPAALLGGPANVDIDHYTLDLQVILSPQKVDGTVRIQGRSLLAGLTQVDVNLHDLMNVTQVRVGALPSAFSRSGHAVHVMLGRPYADQEPFDVTIDYDGAPQSTGFGSFVFATHAGQPIISSLSEPDGAPSWWPCVDRPDDKAIVDMNLTIPSALKGVSNGLLVATIDNGNGTKTWQWRSNYPISTYLVSVAISNYVTWTDFYAPVTGGPAMPVQHWVYPEHENAARQDFSVTVPQLQFFSNLLGEYPFVEEKYGHAIFSFGGGMEHQTVTSYGAGLIRGDNRFDWVVAHEMGHQWFGDSVGPAVWDEIWLNEGFASYSEALWWEHLHGTDGLFDYMASLDSRPFCGPLHAPSCGLFGYTVYDKGAWVLHMLRGVMGDVAFFDGLRDYVVAFQNGSATTDGLRATMEAASGLSLASFFDSWVFQTGEPAYQWSWSTAQTPSGWVTYVRVNQTQPGPIFVMPIRLRVTTGAGSTETILQNNVRIQDFVLTPQAAQPTSLALDPDDWILKTTAMVPTVDGDGDGVPDSADNCLATANPGQANLDGDALGDTCDSDIDGDGLANGGDCAPIDPLNLPPQTEVLGLEISGGSSTLLQWAAQGAGVSYDVLSGNSAGLPSAGGVGNATCLAPGLSVTQTSDTRTPEPDNSFYYLIRARNTCGVGPLGWGSTGQPRLSSACQ